MSDDKNKRDTLEGPPAPPELRVRKGIATAVASRDQEQGAASGDAPGSIPGLSGPNAIGQRAQVVEEAMGALAQVMPDPAPLIDILTRFRAAVITALQSASAPGQPQPLGGALTGIQPPWS